MLSTTKFRRRRLRCSSPDSCGCSRRPNRPRPWRCHGAGLSPSRPGLSASPSPSPERSSFGGQRRRSIRLSLRPRRRWSRRAFIDTAEIPCTWRCSLSCSVGRCGCPILFHLASCPCSSCTSTAFKSNRRNGRSQPNSAKNLRSIGIQFEDGYKPPHHS